MNLKEMLQENNLLQYVEVAGEALIKIRIDSYKKLNGGFNIISGINNYNVLLTYNKGEYGYSGSKVIKCNGYNCYEEIRCFTNAEKEYSRAIAWLGTALVHNATDTIKNGGIRK